MFLSPLGRLLRKSLTSWSPLGLVRTAAPTRSPGPWNLTEGAPAARHLPSCAQLRLGARLGAGSAAASDPAPADAGQAMESGSPARARSRRSSAPSSPRPAKKAAAVCAADAGGQADAADPPPSRGEAEARDEGKPPAAKRARTDRQPKAKAPAADSSPGTAAAADGAAVLPDAPATGAAEPKSKRGQKAEPLPEYTSAMRKPPPPQGVPVLKVLSWNVAGLRALLKKTPAAISQLVAREGVDVVCLQEHKLQGGHTDDMVAAMGLKGWSHYWACSTAKLGYSGVSVHTRTKPLSVTVGLGAAEGGLAPDPEHEVEGRVVTVELPAAFVVSVYVPNSGEGLKRLDYRIKSWDGALAAYLKGLEARGKPVVVTGDLNCAHKEIDIHAPKTNLRSAGFTVEERESFGRLLLGEVGLVDTFRALFPGTVAYTYFTRRFNCREKNKGWRLDYFLTSSSLMPSAASSPPLVSSDVAADAVAVVTPPQTNWRVYDSWILQDVHGSDHLPLGLTLIQDPK